MFSGLIQSESFPRLLSSKLALCLVFGWVCTASEFAFGGLEIAGDQVDGSLARAAGFRAPISSEVQGPASLADERSRASQDSGSNRPVRRRDEFQLLLGDLAKHADALLGLGAATGGSNSSTCSTSSSSGSCSMAMPWLGRTVCVVSGSMVTMISGEFDFILPASPCSEMLRPPRT